MEKESGIMKKLKKDKKITYKMISVCLSLVMMITSFLPMTVQAAGKNEIILKEPGRMIHQRNI